MESKHRWQTHQECPWCFLSVGRRCFELAPKVDPWRENHVRERSRNPRFWDLLELCSRVMFSSASCCQVMFSRASSEQCNGFLVANAREEHTALRMSQSGPTACRWERQDRHSSSSGIYMYASRESHTLGRRMDEKGVCVFLRVCVCM